MNLSEHYPGAIHAVILCETLTEWDMFRRCAVEEGILVLKERMRGSAKTAAEICSNDKARQEVLLQALAEWDHPDFLVYLCAKVGRCDDRSRQIR
jgi:hypothetical protein